MANGSRGIGVLNDMFEHEKVETLYMVRKLRNNGLQADRQTMAVWLQS